MKVTTQREQRAAVANNEGNRRQVEYVAPEVNIYETKEGYVLEAEMPGVSKDGLEITLEGTEITITGHRSEEAPRAQMLLRESSNYDYRRVFDLDPAIDTGKISARMDQGVLTLMLPKSEQVKPRKIKVD